MKKELKFLLIAFFISFFFRIIFFDTSYFIWDEAVYLMHGQLFAGPNAGYEETYLRPPLLPLLISPLWKFFPEHYEMLSRLLVIFLNSFIVVPAYYLGKLIDEKTGILASILISVLPASIINSRYVLTDHLGAILALVTFLLFFIGTFQRKRRNCIYIGSFTLVLSILMKFTNLLLFVMLLPFFIILIKEKAKQLLGSSTIFIICFVPYLLYNYAKYNNPIYTFIMAWQAVAEPMEIGKKFVLYIFNDTFGIIFILFALLGLALFLKYKILNKEVPPLSKLLSYIFLFEFAILLFYFLNIINKGVAKPHGIEWEAERFMLLLIPFILVLASYGLTTLLGLLRHKHAKIMLVMLFAIGSLLLAPQYMRIYTKQIEFENGLRHVTKEMGTYLKDSKVSEFGCMGNCPPVAYYSGKKMSMFFNEKELLSYNGDNILSFKKIEGNGYLINSKTICRENSCVYWYSRPTK